MISALTIAGSDSGGGAGIQADLKTFEAHGVFGTSVLTALTAQNTLGVQGVMGVPASFVKAQLDSVISDFHIGAVKTGMLYSEENILAVASFLRILNIPLVVDPVMVASSGDDLLEPDAKKALLENLIPQATLVTPNTHEAQILAEIPIRNIPEMEETARIIQQKYPNTAVLIKGGHLNNLRSMDYLLETDGSASWFTTEFIDTPNTHGTGCTLSAAITANLATGNSLKDSVEKAKIFITEAIRHSWAHLGKGNGTLRHNFRHLIHEK